MAAEEPGRFLLPYTHPGNTDVLPQLFSGTFCCIVIYLLVFGGFFCLCFDYLCCCEYVQMETLSLLSARQLAEVSSTPGQLTSAAQVNQLMAYVPNDRLPAFFDDFTSAIAVSVHHTHKQPANVNVQIITCL